MCLRFIFCRFYQEIEMIFRLISTIVALVVLAFFVGFNLDNKCDVNVIFHTFRQTPVFFTIIVSFVIGVFFTLPFAFIHKAAVKNKEKKLSKRKELKIRESVSAEPENKADNHAGSVNSPADEFSNSSD